MHCNHNLLSPKTMVAMNPLLGNSKPPNFGKPMDYSRHFHRVCYTGFRPTCAYGVLACGGAWELATTSGELYYTEIYKLKWSKTRLFATTVHFKIFIRIVSGCCSQQDLSLWQPHRFRMSPTSSPFSECAWKDRNLLVLVEY